MQHNFLLRLILSFAFFYIQNCLGQINVLGKPGLLTTPTAQWLDQPLGISLSFIPDAHANQLIYSQGVSPKNRIRLIGTRIALTSFIEVGMNLIQRPLFENNGIGDRHLDFRFLILNETDNRPAIVLGITFPFSRIPLINHDYLVATKSFKKFSLSLGYGSPFQLKTSNQGNFFQGLSLVDKRNNTTSDGIFGNNSYLIGLFCGVNYKISPWCGIMTEYNSSIINTGVFFSLKNWGYISLNSFEFMSPSATFSAQFSLDNAPRLIRKYEKNRM